MLIGAGIAGFHVGVEQQWWAGTAECGGLTGQAKTVEELKAQLFATPVTRCDAVAWSLFGISMAGWNLIVSAAGGVLLAWQVIIRKPSARA
jgi:disulfide bond formation protein DsbB